MRGDGDGDAMRCDGARGDCDNERMRVETGPTKLINHAARAAAEVVAEALGYDEAAASALVRRGGLWVDRARVRDPQATIAADAMVFIHTPPPHARRLDLTRPTILYEDDDLIAIDKPAGAYVEATPWDADDHLRAALSALRPAAPIHLAHRLDRDTSGVLLLSKNPAVNAALQRSFAGHMAHKTYLAGCGGLPTWDELEIVTGHGRSANGVFRVYAADRVGERLADGSSVKEMATRLRVLWRSFAQADGAALVAAEPITGRTHQIRLHLAHLGHPLLGDAKYGGASAWDGAALDAHLLHALRLTLPHPRGGELTIEAPAPEWTRALERLS